ncbi:response regulator [Hyphomicrobium sp.]|jgi:DNA-binding response OmpR family regulator|uniref:response regulator n=1 Tax=Hyphomicrobium sp. TaxID=82 RepID=UPI003567A5EB
MVFADILRGLHVLVVEDEPLIALDIKDILENSDVSVVGPAARVSEALALLAQNRPDAAVLDVRLQADTTTFPVADWLREQGIPFLFQTSDPDLIGPTYAEVPVLRKPFQAEQLLAKLWISWRRPRIRRMRLSPRPQQCSTHDILRSKARRRRTDS